MARLRTPETLFDPRDHALRDVIKNMSSMSWKETYISILLGKQEPVSSFQLCSKFSKFLRDANFYHLPRGSHDNNCMGSCPAGGWAQGSTPKSITCSHCRTCSRVLSRTEQPWTLAQLHTLRTTAHGSRAIDGHKSRRNTNREVRRCRSCHATPR